MEPKSFTPRLRDPNSDPQVVAALLNPYEPTPLDQSAYFKTNNNRLGLMTTPTIGVVICQAEFTWKAGDFRRAGKSLCQTNLSGSSNGALFHPGRRTKSGSRFNAIGFNRPSIATDDGHIGLRTALRVVEFLGEHSSPRRYGSFPRRL